MTYMINTHGGELFGSERAIQNALQCEGAEHLQPISEAAFDSFFALEPGDRLRALREWVEPALGEEADDEAAEMDPVAYGSITPAPADDDQVPVED